MRRTKEREKKMGIKKRRLEMRRKNGSSEDVGGREKIKITTSNKKKIWRLGRRRRR